MPDTIYDVVAIGRPYTDIIIDVPQDFPDRFGLRPGISQIPPATMMAMRSELTANYTILPGGSPPNTLAVIHALRLGMPDNGNNGKLAFLGKVCDDSGGRIFRKAFEAIDVEFPNQNYPSDPGAFSAVCLALKTPDDVSTVVHCPGISDCLTDEDMFPNIVAASRILYLQAHLLFAPQSRDSIGVAIDAAKKAGREVVFSLHDHNLGETNGKIFQERFLPQATMLVGNWDEVGTLLKIAKSSDPLTELQVFVPGKILMLVTDGENGAYIAGRGEFHHIPPYTLGTASNRVGAGDAWVAGFFEGYRLGLPLEQCGEFAAETAAAILEIPGARPAGSLRHITEKYLRGAPVSMRPRRPAPDSLPMN